METTSKKEESWLLCMRCIGVELRRRERKCGTSHVTCCYGNRLYVVIGGHGKEMISHGMKQERIWIKSCELDVIVKPRLSMCAAQHIMMHRIHNCSGLNYQLVYWFTHTYIDITIIMLIVIIMQVLQPTGLRLNNFDHYHDYMEV